MQSPKMGKCEYYPSKGITLMGSHGKNDDYDITFMIMMAIKQGRLKCMNKGYELHDVSTNYMKFLKYDSS
jgi:hypothetical protein